MPDHLQRKKRGRHSITSCQARAPFAPSYGEKENRITASATDGPTTQHLKKNAGVEDSRSPANPESQLDEGFRPSHSLIDLRVEGPYRPTNYRWQLALRHNGPDHIPREFLDPWVFEASNLINALWKCKTAVDHAGLEQREPDKYGAYALYRQPSPHARWEVEARILAREPFESIAQKLAMQPGVIEWYERWFFAVNDRLDACGYILHQVVRWHVQNGKPDVGTIWKFFGYRGGPVVLDAVIYGTRQSAQPQQPNDLAAYLAEDVRLTLQVKAMVAVHLIPTNPATALRLVKMYLRAEQCEAKRKAKQGLSPGHSENLKVFFASLSYSPPGEEDPGNLFGKLPPVKK